MPATHLAVPTRKTPPASAPTKDEGLPAIIARLAEEHGDFKRATEALVEMGEADDKLYREIVNGHFETICSAAMRKHFSSIRSKAWHGERSAQAVKPIPNGWAERVAESLLDGFSLPNGVMLGDATRADVAAAAAGYETRAADATVKGRWLRQIEAVMPSADSVVRKVLTEQRVAEMKADVLKKRGDA